MYAYAKSWAFQQTEKHAKEIVILPELMAIRIKNPPELEVFTECLEPPDCIHRVSLYRARSLAVFVLESDSQMIFKNTSPKALICLDSPGVQPLRVLMSSCSALQTPHCSAVTDLYRSHNPPGSGGKGRPAASCGRADVYRWSPC